jgi:uncharacterized protein
MPASEDILGHITRTIVERFRPYRIVLFGSQARGDAGPDADYDIFVEMDSDGPSVERAIDITRALTPRRWSLDVFVMTPDEVREWQGLRGTLLRCVEQEGRVLYERSAAAGH